MTSKELAFLVGGIVDGDNTIDIVGFQGIEKARGGDITFAVDEKKLVIAERSKASCILTDNLVKRLSKTLIRVVDPKLSFVRLYNVLKAEKNIKAQIHASAIISKTVKLGGNVNIGSGVYIAEGVKVGDNVIIENNSVIKENCQIGNNCHIFPNVILYQNTKLGKHVVIHGGAILGSDGFGYVKDNGINNKFPQLGTVIIEDNVEIGANTTIDRGSLGDTVIGKGSKIDNLCQIAHNVSIGVNLLMAGQTGVSGSTVIGDNVTIGGQVGLVDNIKIGDNVTIGAKSAVIGNVKDGAIIWGVPARPIQQTKRQMAVLSKLARKPNGTKKNKNMSLEKVK